MLDLVIIQLVGYLIMGIPVLIVAYLVIKEVREDEQQRKIKDQIKRMKG